MSTRSGDRRALELTRQLLTRTLGDGPIEIAERCPLDIDQLDRTVHDIAQQERPFSLRVEHEDGAARRVSRREARVDARDDRTVVIVRLEARGKG